MAPDGNISTFWESLRANGVVVVNDWETAYYTNFSGSSGKGPQPMVVSYASSPAAEVIFADPPLTDAPTASIVAADTCFRQVEFVGILKGTQKRALAEKFVDFMLARPSRRTCPADVRLPGQSPGQAAGGIRQVCPGGRNAGGIDPAEIAANREAWIQAWTEAVLR